MSKRQDLNPNRGMATVGKELSTHLNAAPRMREDELVTRRTILVRCCELYT